MIPSTAGREAAAALLIVAMGTCGMLSIFFKRSDFPDILELAEILCDEVFDPQHALPLSKPAELIWQTMVLHAELYVPMCEECFGRAIPLRSTAPPHGHGRSSRSHRKDPRVPSLPPGESAHEASEVSGTVRLEDFVDLDKI